jgi:hypothetical protein
LRCLVVSTFSATSFGMRSRSFSFFPSKLGYQSTTSIGPDGAVAHGFHHVLDGCRRSTTFHRVLVGSDVCDLFKQLQDQILKSLIFDSERHVKHPAMGQQCATDIHL